MELLCKDCEPDRYGLMELCLHRCIGTVDNPVLVKSAGDEQYVGCTGVPADSHTVWWLTVCALCFAVYLQAANSARSPANAPLSAVQSAATWLKWSM